MDFRYMPLGFAMGITMREDAREAYDRLTEAEKEQVIFECRDAKSKADMDRIIDRLSGKFY